MNSEHLEYNRDTNPYPSFGKKYNGEKAIISLTSWEKRIETCPKTIFSLLTQCKGFHIVLVLSEEEFPKMEKELPDNLMLFVNNELIEVLWVYNNYKSFKKVLFTMDKYRDVPVISADDDCIYTCNYAEELYQKCKEEKFQFPVIWNSKGKHSWTQGPATIYPPKFFCELFETFDYEKWKKKGDDDYLGDFFKKNKIDLKSCNHFHFCYYFHDEIKPLNGSKNNPNWLKKQAI